MARYRYVVGKGWDNGSEPPSKPNAIKEMVEAKKAPTFSVSSSSSQRGDEVVYYSQLAEKPNDPNAWMSHDDAKRKCDEKGYTFSSMKSFSD